MSGPLYVIGSGGYIGSMIREIFPTDSLIRVEKNNSRISQNFLNQVPKKVPQGSTCIILAALSNLKKCEKNKKMAFKTNVELVKKICDLNFKKIVFASTSSVYGSSKDYATEESAPYITSYYAETKLLAEEIILSDNNNIVARLAIVIGQSPRTNWSQLVNNMVKTSLDGLRINIYGPNSFRPYYDVFDVAKGLIFLMDTNYFNSQIVNVGNTLQNISKLDLIKEIKKLLPSINYIIESEHDKRNYKVSFKKFEKRFNHSINLNNTLKNLIKYYKTIGNKSQV